MKHVLVEVKDPLEHTTIPSAVKLMSNPQIAILFTTLQQILNINSIFLKKLRNTKTKSTEGHEEIVPIGSLFSEFSAYLDCYSVYASRHDEAMMSISQAMQLDPILSDILNNKDTDLEVNRNNLTIVIE